MSALRSSLTSLLALVFIGCSKPAARADTITRPAADSLHGDSCPPLDTTAMVPSTDVVIDGRAPLLHRAGYVSILVDGQRAAWNQPNENPGPQNGLGLDPNDIETVERLKPVVARSAYGTCPGVTLILITTKSKHWRPYTR